MSPTPTERPHIHAALVSVGGSPALVLLVLAETKVSMAEAKEDWSEWDTATGDGLHEL